MECDHCKNSFLNKRVLLHHQTTAKYCLKLQGKNQDDIADYICQVCDKTFTRKELYIYHKNICKTNSVEESILLEKEKNKTLKEKNKILKTRIIELEKINAVLEARLEEKIELSNEFKSLHSKKDNCIEKIALQPKTTTKNTSNSTQNNILNNLPIFNLTKEKLQLIARTEFTHELFLRGQEGAAKFATNIARKENDGDLPWVVADKNRGIVKMKGEDGIIITDYDVEIITELVFEAIKDKNQEYFDAAYPPYDSDAEELDPDEAERVEANKARADKCFSDIAKMRRNNKVFKKKLIEYSL